MQIILINQFGKGGGGSLFRGGYKLERKIQMIPGNFVYFKATLAKRIMGFPPFGVSADVTLQDLTKIGYLVVSLPSDVVTYHN